MPRTPLLTTTAGPPPRAPGFWPAWVLLCAGSLGAFGAANAPVSFNRDIRPVLSDNCFSCHGFDAGKRKADLRLDTAEGLTADHHGRQAVKPGDPAQSEIWRRISSPDPKTVMPPPESGRRLTPEQIALLRRWILEGGAFQKHWAFEPPVRPELPLPKATNWLRNDIDRFVFAALDARDLAPSPEAPKEGLIRRVTLDLTGLPPSLEEVDAFLGDPRPDAYERLVDRLLASPSYGEHMARYWLDLARYGDTHGLHLDNERSLWPYRDWVVDAFNRNLPFDQFTIWQLAGDLLPKPTREQLVASGFNRCNLSTGEGGAIEEEFQVRYAVDRVETTATTWMGLTLGCAVCHDHKFDPVSQKEFYEVFSIFNNIAEKAMDENALLPPPAMPLPTPEQEQRKARLDRAIADLEKKLKEQVATLKYTDPATLTNAPKPEPKEIVWVEDDFPARAQLVAGGDSPTNAWRTASDGPVFSEQKALRLSGKGLRQIRFTNAEPLVIGAGDKLFAYVDLDPKDPPQALMLQFYTDSGEQRVNWGDAETIGAADNKLKDKIQLGALPETNKWVRLEIAAARLGFRPGTKITGLGFVQFDGTAYWDKAGQVSVSDPAQNPDLSLAAWEKFEKGLGDKSKVPPEIKDLFKKDAGKRDDKDREKLRDYFISWAYRGPEPDLLATRDQVLPSKEQRETLEKEIVSTMISKELEKPRPSWVLVRGQYDKHGEPVGPGVPAILPPLPAAEVTNRLTFARWLVDPKHPLTSRVTVNRLWQQFFGTGIVKTAEDFGTRGEWPSHPELLDWLATEFIGSGWDVKHLVRLMVTSATYRQDSRAAPRLWQLDPENRWLARGPRRRLDAEVLRDSALSFGGLLKSALGGRGVRPYQPAGIWEAVGYTTSNTAKYTQDHGDALYRRSLYLFWKRTAPPPSMTTFDAPSREQCRARRERTNTPLQALLTMNDPQYVEAARHLGFRLLHDGGQTDDDRLRLGFRLVTARVPADKELAVLTHTLVAQRVHYAADQEAAKQLIAVGESPVPDSIPASELAAYTVVANLLLNLDETLTNH